MSQYVCIGIDPGVSGGMVALYPSGQIDTLQLKSRYDICNWLKKNREWGQHQYYGVRVLIEQVYGFIGETNTEGQKTNVASAHTMFTLGESYGQLTMALVCLGLSFQEVLPKEWQKVYDIKRLKDETKTKFKNRIKDKVIGLFPKEKITLALSDAYILAHLCRARNT